MKFGTKYEEVKDEVSEGGGGGNFFRTFKDGDTEILVLKENGWTAYWEHNQYPVGFPFPCTEKSDCPGCTSPKQDVQRRQRKFLIPALSLTTNHKGEEVEYVNIYKVPRAIADKLALRRERRSTLRDRTYIVTRTKTGPNAYDVEYDIEANDPVDRDFSKIDIPTDEDEQAILTEMFENRNQTQEDRKKDKQTSSGPKSTFGKRPEPESEKTDDGNTDDSKAEKEAPAPFDDGPYEEREYSWDDLTAMSRTDLYKVIAYEQHHDKLPAEDLSRLDKEQLLDWLSENAS